MARLSPFSRSKPQRPSLPFALWCALALWAGAAASFLAGPVHWETWWIMAGTGALLLALAVMLLLVRREGPFQVPLLALFAVLGVVLAGAQIASLDVQRAHLMELDAATGHSADGRSADMPWTVRIEEDPGKTAFGVSALAQITSNVDGSSAQVTLYADADERLSYGDEFVADLSLSAPKEDRLRYCNQNGLVVQAQLEERQALVSSALGQIASARNGFVETIKGSEVGSPEAKALVAALVAGDRSELFDLPLYQEVKVLGLAHLVAVSGSHLVIVMGFIGVALRFFRCSRKVSLALELAFLFLYLAAVGFPISCVRAALMTAVSLVSFMAFRRSHALSGLSCVILALVGLSPSVSCSVSFALSALSTLGILLFTPLLTSWFKRVPERCQRVVVEPLCLTLASLLMTFPLTMVVFSQFSLISPLANVLAVPFVTAICCVGVVAFVVQGMVPLCTALLNVACGLSEACVAGCHVLASVPIAAIPVSGNALALGILAVLVVSALWVLWPRRFPVKATLAVCTSCFVLALALLVVNAQRTEIVMLDVGQGDAFLLRSQGAAVLVDTGNQPQRLLAGLAQAGCYHLDGLIITHADDDHSGCIADLKGTVGVDRVLLAQGTQEVRIGKTQDLVGDAQFLVGSERVAYVNAGDMASFGNMTLRFVWPDGLRDEGGNQDSLCFVLDVDVDGDGQMDWNAFFSGDAETEVIETLVNRQEVSDVSVLKVAHHGSRAALSQEALLALDPEIALISVGVDNTYGHPTAQTLGLLEESGARVFRSDENGGVVCEFEPEKIRVRALR